MKQIAELIRTGDLISTESNRFYSKEVWSFRQLPFNLVIYGLLDFQVIDFKLV